jgi:ABC-2 type transport system ATP-binding protein
MPGVASVKREDGAVLVYSRDVAATIGAVLDAAESLGVEPANLGVRRATLEDVFLDLTGRALRD